jgi:hypothetical protein
MEATLTDPFNIEMADINLPPNQILSFTFFSTLTSFLEGLYQDMPQSNKAAYDFSNLFDAILNAVDVTKSVFDFFPSKLVRSN